MEQAAQEFGALQFNWLISSDACQQLVERIAVSEAVERCIPVRMLI
jgi:hypothetical protein